MLPPQSIASSDDTPLTAATPPQWQSTRSAGANLSTMKVPLGEELPIFCERCGYCLHGVAQHVCELCTVRQFHCPECGHHQAINTLRPAFQKILGRLRAAFLAVVVFIKINFFGWLLFGWVAMGNAWSYIYRYERFNGIGNSHFVTRELDVDVVVAFLLFALAFSMVGRMLLLRWRRGYLVGLALATLVCGAVILGAFWRKWEREGPRETLPSPLTTDFVTVLVITAAAVVLGASIVWGLWSALAHIFLPRRTSQALLNWQRSQSNDSAAHLARTGP